jgi:hypothetical protein
MGEKLLAGERRFVCDQCGAQRKVETRPDSNETIFYYVAAFRAQPLDRSTIFVKKEVCGVACMSLVVTKIVTAYHRVNGGHELILSTGALVERASDHRTVQ